MVNANASFGRVAPVTDEPGRKPAPDPFDLPDVKGFTIGVLGGTGDQGRGLARRWAMAGHRVIIGSRNARRALDVALEMGVGVTGTDNPSCADEADIVVIAVPWAGHADLIKSVAAELAGKIVIDCVNPMGFDKGGAYVLDVAEGSALQQAAALLPESRVVGAFHNVSATWLLDESAVFINTDVLVLGDDREATDIVQALAGRINGVRGLYGGKLRNARQVEGLTANLISINRRYKAHAGIRITDV